MKLIKESNCQHIYGRGGTPSGSGGRTTPSHMIRPIPQHIQQQQGHHLQVNYSPVNVSRFSQSPVRIPKFLAMYGKFTQRKSVDIGPYRRTNRSSFPPPGFKSLK